MFWDVLSIPPNSSGGKADVNKRQVYPNSISVGPITWANRTLFSWLATCYRQTFSFTHFMKKMISLFKKPCSQWRRGERSTLSDVSLYHHDWVLSQCPYKKRQPNTLVQGGTSSWSNRRRHPGSLGSPGTKRPATCLWSKGTCRKSETELLRMGQQAPNSVTCVLLLPRAASTRKGILMRFFNEDGNVRK